MKMNSKELIQRKIEKLNNRKSQWYHCPDCNIRVLVLPKKKPYGYRRGYCGKCNDYFPLAMCPPIIRNMEEEPVGFYEAFEIFTEKHGKPEGRIIDLQ